ncbi:MAG TPA: ABC transporter substrate-binding protein [Methanosarcinaceae archaeon]|nr:ABC transporter substrate-binding protein [Methanosarcinaceae archaeon]
MTGNNFLFGLVITVILLTCMPVASASTYTLGVFGNANEDDTIDLKDVEYTTSVVLGLDDQTQLADAKYNGEINILDVTQTELIMLGKEKELTVFDADDKIVTVPQPIDRIVVYHHQCAEMLQVLDLDDKVVGVRDTFETQFRRFPVISAKPSIGSGDSPDIEAILSVEPDVVMAYTFYPEHESLDDKLPDHIAVLRMGCSGIGELGGTEDIDAVREEAIKLGYIFDAIGEAERYLEWHDKYVDEISKRISEIPDDERLRVFVESSGGTDLARTGIGGGHPAHGLCLLAGGINIGAGCIPVDLDGSGCEYGDIEVEWILDQNPEVILGRAMGSGIRPYELDDNALLKAYHDEIKSLPGSENVAAVKNDRVYLITNDHAITPNYPSALAAMAKWFYPDRFEDMDPQAIHQEYMDLMDISFDVYEQGAFVYPELS